MENVFVITDFGAVGDGKTDCTAAIQSALDEAAAVSGKVVVPPGVFMTVGGLKMRGKGVSLCGTPAWSFRNDGASVLKLCGDKADCMLDISGAFGCTIHGICMNGAGLGENIHGIKLYWDRSNGGGQEDTPTVDDCRIGNFTGDGGVLPVSPDYGVIMRNCENSILKENAMHNGSLKNNLIEENNTGCIIADNVGCLYSGD